MTTPPQQPAFLRYPSLENHYQQKFINNFTTLYPQLESETMYIITEKLHGANVCFIFTPHQPVTTASRNQILAPQDKFYDLNHAVHTQNYFRDLLEGFQALSDYEETTYHIYGEYFGKTQKGVKYNIPSPLQNDYRIFDIRRSANMLTPELTIKLLYDLQLLHYYVPIISYPPDLPEALEFDVETFNSVISPRHVENNIAEGVVIRPYQKNFFSPVGEIFIIKKKAEAFLEKSSEKKNPQEKTAKFSEEVLNLNTQFRDYLTDSRMQGVFSKYGEIKAKDEIPNYVKYLLQDAQEDFLKDLQEDLSKFTKNEQKAIFNASSLPFSLLKPYL